MNIAVLLNGIADYLLVVTMIAGILTPIVCGIIKLARIRTPIYRHMIWLYLLIVIVTAPLMWLYGPKLTLTVLPAPAAPTAIMPLERGLGHDAEVVQNMSLENRIEKTVTPVISAQASSNQSHPFPLKTVLITAWLVGVVFMLARLVVGFSRLRRICLTAQPVETLQIENVLVLASSQIAGPVCCGFRRPIILLPEQLVIDNNADDLQMVLNHEMAHIERKDCWMNLLQRIIEAVFFFNPFIWYASRQLTQECERICDNYVLAEGASPIHYVNLLSRIVEHNIHSKRLQAVAMVEGRLLPRIRSLLDPKRNGRTKASPWTIITCTAAILLVLTASAIRLEAKSGQDVSSESVAPGQNKSADSSTTDLIDPNVKKLGDAVRKRITTYSDVNVFTLEDGETATMKIKENIAGVAEVNITPHIVAAGTRFDAELFNDKGISLGKILTTDAIHDKDDYRTGHNSQEMVRKYFANFSSSRSVKMPTVSS